MTYLKTKFVRALISSIKVTQDALSRVYQFVPIQDFDKPWTDEDLYTKYKLSGPERDLINKMIATME